MDPLQGELGHSDVTRSLFDADTIAPQSTKHLREKKVNYEKAKTKQKKRTYTNIHKSKKQCGELSKQFQLQWHFIDLT